ncbi:MAG TPA: copper chaperone PCu(A)C [Gammaproteobacteria bacterium]|nr:copper chaperone PCu(A)C [Gammaproteobacteria bacterium]
MTRHLFPLMVLCVSFLPAAMAADGPTVRASHVWIREAAPGVDVMAGYFVLENLTDQSLALTQVGSPDFGAVMMHQSVLKDGQESMLEVAQIVIPAHGSIEFKPGGYHLMLMQPKKNLYSGDMVTLMLTFSDRSGLTIMANVRRDPPAH